MRAKLIITFDDGTLDQYHAVKYLNEKQILAVIGVCPKYLGTPGYMTIEQAQELKALGNIVAGHSFSHMKLGQYSMMEIVNDAVMCRTMLEKIGLDSGHFITPFGSNSIASQEHVHHLEGMFGWIRLGQGGQDCNNEWIPTGGYRLYPIEYKNKTIGLSAQANVRDPNGIRRTVQNACDARALAVVAYHGVNHVYGNNTDIQWDQFVRDVSFFIQNRESIDFSLPVIESIA